MTTITEADAEQAAPAWLEGLGWQVADGPDIEPGDASRLKREAPHAPFEHAAVCRFRR